MPSRLHALSGLRGHHLLRCPGPEARQTTWPIKLQPILGFGPRQWQLQRAAHSIPSRAQPRVRRVASPPAPATGNNHSQLMQDFNSAILIPSSVKDIQPAELIQHIHPVAQSHLARDTFCIVLVTPAFATWLLSNHDFLSNVVHRAYSEALDRKASPITVEVLCAVVDKLPAGRTLKARATIHEEVARYAKEMPNFGTGYEGVAFTTLPAAASVPSTSPRSLDRGAIDFIFPVYTPSSKPHQDVWQVPLANTVFQTGTPTTMVLTKWTLNSEGKSFHLQQRKDISHHGVAMSTSGIRRDWSSALQVPLIPLTYPRLVKGAMGNIIRRVVGPEKTEMTASAELEKMVPQFFKARGEPPQPTTAWALVIPLKQNFALRKHTSRVLSRQLQRKETTPGDLWARLWEGQRGDWNRIIPRALARGARLHRVLSGGGGWGQKAGLLSLDPVPVSEEMPIRMEDATSSIDGPGDFSSALTPVVKDGDAIQFFIPVTSPRQAEDYAGLETLKALPTQGSLGWEFGTIPSTIDSIPGSSWQHTESTPKHIAVFQKCFGVLAEGGLTLSRRRADKPSAPFYTFMTSMIDAPYTRFWSVEVVDQTDPTRTFEYSWLHESKDYVTKMGNGTEVRSPDSSIIPDDGMKATPRMPSIRQVSVGADVSRAEKTFYRPFANQDSDIGAIARSCMPNTRQVTAQTDITKNNATQSLRQSLASQPAAVEIKDRADLRTHAVYVRRVASQGELESTWAREKLQHIMYTLYSLTEELRDVRRILRLSQRRLYKEVGLTRSISAHLPQIGDEGDFKIRKVQTSVQSSDLAVCHNVPVKKSENLSGKALSIREYVSKTSSLSIRQFVSKASKLREYYDLQRRDRVARIMHVANKSAFEVYGLHVALRLQLGRVIMYGKKQDCAPNVTIKRLEACLITLRAFGEVLYSGTTLSSGARVRKKLTGIELQNPIQRFLVRSIDPGAQLRGRTSRRAADGRTLVHYRRNRTSRKSVSRAVRLRFATRRAIRYHTSAPRTLPRQPIKKVRANWQRRQARSWRRVQSFTKKESSSRPGLVQTVSSWLGGSPVTTKAAAPVAARRRRRRRPFGSRAFGSEEEE